MSRPREDMPLSIWVDYGGNLSKHLVGNRKTYKAVKKLVAALCVKPAPAANKQHELVTALNGYKDELGTEWGKWKKELSDSP